MIKGISEIAIPAEAVDITDASEDYTTEIDIRNYLPSKVFLDDSEDAKKTITVRIEA